MSVRRASDRLSTAVTGIVRRDEPLARRTTYRIGGPAALYIECDTLSSIGKALDILSEEGIEWTVLGRGSNVLASDEGYDGAVIVLGREFKRHRVEGDRIRTGSGVVLAAIVRDAYSRGLGGLEFAAGIPGTVGGALAMNAGSRDAWIGSLVDTVTLWVPGVGLRSFHHREIEWGYRSTDLVSRGVVVESELRLHEADRETVRRVTDACLTARRATQPVGTANAGSVFKNPQGDSAGRLIEACGFKGRYRGGAQVSEIHANFIINTGDARAADVLGLISEIREAVSQTYGIELEAEIRFLGRRTEA
ncbi:MAG: UDP-N-acetylmuramate dehydrogenase [Clostridiales bacterium]|nr:UDP-N-acetylmuramate dehydrogenase [Clostridiales bacterium]